MEIKSTVPQHLRGKELLHYLTERFTYLSQDEWLLRIAEKRFSINGTSAEESDILSTGDLVIYDMPDFVEPEADLNYSVVFENDDFMAINKTGNLLVHKKGASIRNNLIYQLRECHNPPYKEAHIVNRLDRETSGLVLVAKKKDALKELNALFSERKVAKEYLAVVHGSPEQQSGEVAASIGKDEECTITFRAKIDGVKAKEAFTSYEVVTSGEKYSLMKLTPITGRTHQLRVHCLSLGTPIVGDKIYAMAEEEYLLWRQDPKEYGDLEFPRQALHCAKLSFLYKGEEFIIEAPLLQDMESLVNLI